MRWTAVIAPLRRPGALVGATALLLSTGIVVNALFLQSSHHPAPLFAPDEFGAETEKARPDGVVEAVQSALRAAGYYDGAADGLAGPRTRAAIEAYERQAGRTPTGRATPELLEAILSDAIGDIAAAGDADDIGDLYAAEPETVPEPQAAPDPRVAAVQGALSRAAYGQIVADGMFGPQTSEAIRRFQADHGLPPTGAISDALMVELQAAGALRAE